MIEVLDYCIHCDSKPSYGMKLQKVIDNCRYHRF